MMLEEKEAPVLWRGPVIAGAVKQFWHDVVWGDLDYLLIDCPPGTGDVPLTVFQTIPLDGAVIVTGGRIRAAGCILPLSANLNISKELGTRHRAALGMSEAYDSISLVVSEENGYISLASGGVLKRRLSPENLEKILCDQLLPKTDTEQKASIIDWMKGLKKK